MMKNGWVGICSSGALLTSQGERTSLRRRASDPPKTKGQAFVARLKGIWESVSAIMTVPMYAAILSMIIALIPPFQRALKEVEPLERAIKSAGQCSSKWAMRFLEVLLIISPSHYGRARSVLLHSTRS